MPASNDDTLLIARVLANDDRVAFGMLVQRHQSSVRARLRRLCNGNEALADDLAQETFVLAWRKLQSFRQEARFSTWLYRIATNCWLADARKRKEVLFADHDAIDDGNGEDAMTIAIGATGDASDAVALGIDLDRARAALSAGERAAIVQCYDNDLSHEEAAVVLGCPVGTLKT
ncbi:MAG: sigma-70 family RNA polymerase sigma factor, partial [Casimicrobiaceae bacterium]